MLPGHFLQAWVKNMDEAVTGMNKASLAWTVLRVLGLLLLGKALVIVSALIVQVASVYNLLTAASIIGARPDEQATPQLWGPVLVVSAESLVVGFLAYYFLRQGASVHRLLLHETRSPGLSQASGTSPGSGR